MIYQRIFLENEDEESVFLEMFVADPLPGLTRDAILILPGGGYRAVNAWREGEPVAMAFMPYGYNAFVLHYSTRSNSDKSYPAQLIQASKAMKYIRDHAEEFHIDPERIFVAGFSAGGHLAACLGTMWHREEIYNAVEMPYGYNKPRGMMLVYPVISGVTDFAHRASFCNLWQCDEEPTEEQLEYISIEKHVSEKSSPVFAVHPSTDQTASVRHTLTLGEAYAKLGLPFELHIYQQGAHAMVLGNEVTQCNEEEALNPCFAKWVEQAVAWTKQI